VNCARRLDRSYLARTIGRSDRIWRPCAPGRGKRERGELRAAQAGREGRALRPGVWPQRLRALPGVPLPLVARPRQALLPTRAQPRRWVPPVCMRPFLSLCLFLRRLSPSQGPAPCSCATWTVHFCLSVSTSCRWVLPLEAPPPGTNAMVAVRSFLGPSTQLANNAQLHALSCARIETPDGRNESRCKQCSQLHWSSRIGCREKANRGTPSPPLDARFSSARRLLCLQAEEAVECQEGCWRGEEGRQGRGGAGGRRGGGGRSCSAATGQRRRHPGQAWEETQRWVSGMLCCCCRYAKGSCDVDPSHSQFAPVRPSALCTNRRSWRPICRHHEPRVCTTWNSLVGAARQEEREHALQEPQHGLMNVKAMLSPWCAAHR
jgi:hypothetical protein